MASNWNCRARRAGLHKGGAGGARRFDLRPAGSGCRGSSPGCTTPAGPASCAAPGWRVWRWQRRRVPRTGAAACFQPGPAQRRSSQSSSSVWRTGLTMKSSGGCPRRCPAPCQTHWPTRWPPAAGQPCSAGAAADGLPAVDAGHGQVHQDHIGPVAGGQQVQASWPLAAPAQLKAQRLQQLHQQFAVGLFVVHHQDACGALPRSPRAGAPRAQRACQRPPRRLCTSGRNSLTGTPSPGPACWSPSARRPSGRSASWRWSGPGRAPGAGAASAVLPRAKGSKMRSMLLARSCRGRCPRSRSRHLARMAHAKVSPALRGELDGIAQQVDEDLAHALFVGAHQFGQVAPWLEAEASPLACACSSNMPPSRACQSAKRMGLTSSVSLPPRCGRCPACLRSATAGARRRA
jgi:hypothetical protein